MTTAFSGRAGRAAAFAVTGLAALLAADCGAKKVSAPPKETIPVTVGMVELQAVPLEVSAIGNVQPFTTVAMTARVGGQLDRVEFREGQDVRKGDTLVYVSLLAPNSQDTCQTAAKVAESILK